VTKKIVTLSAVLFIAFFTLHGNFNVVDEKKQEEQVEPVKPQEYREITGSIKKGETLSDIFKKYKLDLADLFRLREASADIHKLRKLLPDRPYKILLDDKDRINRFTYWIDDDTILNINSTGSGFCAEKVPVQYEKRVENIEGTIKDNLISSLGAGKGTLLLALELSDIFAWDIDFSTDVRNGDIFKVVVEGLYLDGEFKKYGDILSAEFVNAGETYRGYRFECDGRADYYDADGKSLRKAFLKAPLSFRRISSTFTRGRFHPILKIYRPHHGVDYAAPTGTPVSAAGDGMVLFSGKRGQYGNLVVLRHWNGYKTYYGHLSRIAKGVRAGRHLEQGSLVGYGGATGLATGPHLHYEMRIDNRPVNPLSVKIPHGRAIPSKLMARFRSVRDRMNTELASMNHPAASVASGAAGVSSGANQKG